VAGDEITVEQALRAVRVLWIDARSEADYGRGHIPGAVLLNEDSWEKLLPAVLSAWQPDDLVIVYCDSGRCDASHKVAQRLTREAGIDGVKVLKGGWQAWSGRPQSAE
jgi:rhodanese-related sulfurtransferase